MNNNQKALAAVGLASFLTGLGLTVAGVVKSSEDGHPDDQLFIPGGFMAIGIPLIALLGWVISRCKKEEENPLIADDPERGPPSLQYSS